MTPPADTARYQNHRFPGELMSHGVWLSYRFTLSYRDVEELLLERGIDVSHEAIRQWCRKFGQDYANWLRHRRPQPGDKWHLEGFWRVMKDTIGAGRCFADLHLLYQRARQVLMAHQERPIYEFHW
jgi:transposase-like protein